jgi:dipeptidase E
MPHRLLLVSNSTQHGRGYLDHVIEEVAGFLGAVKRLVFVPYALAQRDLYGEKVRQRLAEIGVVAETATADADGSKRLRDTPAIFVGGGNTFRLLKILQETGQLAVIRERAQEGMPYLGSSAGSVITSPTIRTTNDMPIVEPATLASLALLPFQLNLHYIDADPRSTHMGETREERLLQFHEENELPVLGVREGAWLRVEGNHATLGGTTGGRLFRRGHAPEEVAAGADVSGLFAGPVEPDR